MDSRLDWIEKAALDNIKAHINCADVLAKEAAATLTILIAALSGAFSFAVQTADYKTGAVALTVYLFMLCATLVTRCMVIGELPQATNEPRNLDQPGFELEALRTAELKNIQARIDQAASRNAKTARWLNYVRLAAIGAPAVFLIATLSEELARHVG